MSKICAIGERKLIGGKLYRKDAVKHKGSCGKCSFYRSECPGYGESTPIEEGGNECEGSSWVRIKNAAQSDYAATWARQASLPDLPEALTGEHRDRAQRVRDDVANLLTMFADEMDAEGGAK